ncbi:MAG: hypothetical protein KatS3mg111_2920 [Pirellulaceae bacterium]|nr:MAG: hypothetical protein KatS3mg111_2920 [Pirellulaceae bacterium]
MTYRCEPQHYVLLRPANGIASASLAADDTSTWNGSASSSASSSVDYQQHYDSVDQAIMLLGEMGWDYQSLRDASFQRSANWNALFDPSTGQFNKRYSVLRRLRRRKTSL